MGDPSVSEAVDQPQLSIFATNHYATTSCTLTPLLHREYFRPNLIKRLQHSCNRPRRPVCWVFVECHMSGSQGGQQLALGYRKWLPKMPIEHATAGSRCLSTIYK